MVLEIISNNMNYYVHRNSIKEAILITRDWFTHFWLLIKEENDGKAYSQKLKIMTGNYMN